LFFSFVKEKNKEKKEEEERKKKMKNKPKKYGTVQTRCRTSPLRI